MEENSVTMKLVGGRAEIEATYYDGGTRVTIHTSVDFGVEDPTIGSLREVPALMALQLIKEAHPKLVIAQFGQ